MVDKYDVYVNKAKLCCTTAVIGCCCGGASNVIATTAGAAAPLTAGLSVSCCFFSWGAAILCTTRCISEPPSAVAMNEDESRALYCT
jgi:hypothetical protein